MSKYVAYYRVSTNKQGVSGLGLEAQQAAVKAYANGHGVIVAEFTEVESGKKSSRPELIKALKHAKVTGSILIIAKLDRLSRNVNFISSLMESNVEFVACDFPQANRLTIHILAAVAEHEAEAISQRTKSALAAAKARGVVLGQPKGSNTFGRSYNPEAVIEIKDKATNDAEGYRDIINSIKAEGFTSVPKITAELNFRGIKTVRNGQWHLATVHSLLKRLAG